MTTNGGPATPAPTPRPYTGVKWGGTDLLWQHIFGDQKGLLAIWSGRRVPNQKDLVDPATKYFEWPRRALDAIQHLERESDNSREAYFCAHLLTKRRRIKENAALILAAYVDGDGAQPGPGVPPPTAVVESSPGRQQFYWRFTKAIDPERAEQINRRLAYAMSADKSGWDLTQVLRGPGCRNWKYTPAPRVEIISIEDALAYDPDELERILPQLPAEATAVRAEVKLGQQDAATPISDRDQRALEKMYASKRGSDLLHLANGGSLRKKPDGSPDHSADDLSYFNGLAFWLDKDASRMAAAAWRSGRVRNKWNETHSAKGETYVEMTIGEAIGGCRQTFRELTGYDAGDEPPSIGRLQFKPPAAPVSSSTTAGGEPSAVPEACPCAGDHAKCAEIAELRGTVRDLTAWVERLAGLEEDRQAVIRETRAERDQLAEQIAGWKAILSNPKLKPADRIVAIPIVDQVRHARLNGQDEIHVRYPGIVNGWGIPESTVQKSVAVVTDMVGAPLAKRNEPDKPVLVDTKHGPKEVTPWKTIVSATVEGDLYAAVGSYDPGLPQRGGKRTPVPQCKDHPNADVIVRSVTQCATCRKPIAPAREQTIRRQNEGVNNPPPASVDDSGTYCRQNDSVRGHDGAEQSERASKVIPIDTRPGRPRRHDAGLGRIRMTRPPTREVPAPPGCTRMGCDEPAANGFTCTAHLRDDPLPAIAGAEE